MPTFSVCVEDEAITMLLLYLQVDV